MLYFLTFTLDKKNWHTCANICLYRYKMLLERMNTITFTPYFSALIQNRIESWAIVGTGALQIGLHLAGLPGWACPFKSVFGIPCPGCGLTTATGQFLHGQFSESLQTHAFAPFFLFAVGLMAILLFLPEKTRLAAAARIEKLEKKTGTTTWFLVFLFLYWGFRLAGMV